MFDYTQANYCIKGDTGGVAIVFGCALGQYGAGGTYCGPSQSVAYSYGGSYSASTTQYDDADTTGGC